MASLTDLDLTSLKAILSIKSDQEDIGDFSFSFNQTDLALAVVQWIKADFEGRHQVVSGTRNAKTTTPIGILE